MPPLRDTDLLRHALLRLSLHANHTLATSGSTSLCSTSLCSTSLCSNQSLPNNLRVLWHLGMHGEGSAEVPIEFPSDEEANAEVDDDVRHTELTKRPSVSAEGGRSKRSALEDSVYRLSLHPVPIHWHLSTQLHCIAAVLEFLPPDKNVVLSPFSLISCMAMLCRGATEGPARDQLAYYCWPCLADGAVYDDSVALEALSTFVNQLKGVEACKYANILMTDHANVEEYEKDISKHFKTKPRCLNEFAQVNEEVQEITTIQKKVLPVEPEGTVLINAVYFADQWTYKFDEELTSEPFKQATGDMIYVDMMHQKTRLDIAQFDDVTAVHLEYNTPGIGAWFVKHDIHHTHAAAYDALQRFVQRVFVHKIQPTHEHVELTVPKFEMDSSIDLLRLFSAASTTHQITHVFDPGGHLSRMSTDGNEAVSRFDQECILKVDQKGTVAAAKTVLAMTRGGDGRPSYQDISFAHTFYMVIHHNDTILFVAKVASPTPSPPAAQLVLPPAQAPLPNPEIQLRGAGVAIKVPVTIPEHTKILSRTLRVEVRQHEDKTATSEYTEPSYNDRTDETTIPTRVYTVQPVTKDNMQLIQVTITFQGQHEEPKDTFIMLRAVYITEDGIAEPEKHPVQLKINEPYDLPFPLAKKKGEREDGWDLRDDKNNTVLKLRFIVP